MGYDECRELGGAGELRKRVDAPADDLSPEDDDDANPDDDDRHHRR